MPDSHVILFLWKRGFQCSHSGCQLQADDLQTLLDVYFVYFFEMSRRSNRLLPVALTLIFNSLAFRYLFGIETWFRNILPDTRLDSYSSNSGWTPSKSS